MLHTPGKESDNWLSPSVALNRFDTPADPAIKIQQTQSRRMRYGFRVGPVGLLINFNTVSEVIENTTICPVPHTPSWLSGLINLRGNLLPIFDLQKLLALQRVNHNEKRILILDKGEQAVGIIIDDLPRALDVSQKLPRLPPLPSVLRACVSEAYSDDSVVWLEFNHQSFFFSLATQIATPESTFG
jgi:twitching motility protein PilI